MSSDIITEIKELTKSKKCKILAHNYQPPEIQALADIRGDSLQLAQAAVNLDCEIILLAGVTFMAETASILNPEKKVIVPTLHATCPLANYLSTTEIKEARKQYPDAAVAVYINTLAETKAEADICVTSSNAEKIIAKLDERIILFGPDRNLAAFVQKKVTNKRIIALPEKGHCYVHRKFVVNDVKAARKRYPNATMLVHPEVDPSIQDLADQILSTGKMVRFTKTSEEQEFIIGTEIGLIDQLRSELPHKIFYPLRNDAVCIQMKKNTIYNLYSALKNEINIVIVPEDIAERARRSIKRMLELSK
ncbi:MAG: quinolinate synthase NadA [Promethearchaeota archaeon]